MLDVGRRSARPPETSFGSVAAGRSVPMRHLSLKLKSSPARQGAGLVLLSLGLGCGSPGAVGSTDDADGSPDSKVSTSGVSTGEGDGGRSNAEGSAGRGTVKPIVSPEAGLDSRARPPIDGDAAA